MLDMLDKVTPAITGLISGAIGSFIAPWASWGIEKRRKKQEAREALIAKVREILSDPPQNDEFRMLPIYSRLKPHLSKKTVSAIEGKYDSKSHTEVIQIVSGSGRYSGVNPYAQDVLDEVARLEKNWGLL